MCSVIENPNSNSAPDGAAGSSPQRKLWVRIPNNPKAPEERKGFYLKTTRVCGDRSAFTLIEILMATVMIGIAVAALMVANGSLSQANGAGLEMTNAEFFIDQLRELTVTLPCVDPVTTTNTFGAETGETLATYDDLDDFNGKTYSPPIDSGRNSLTAFPGYSETITVENVSASDLRTHAANHSTRFYHFTVTVSLNGKQLAQSSWIRADTIR